MSLPIRVSLGISAHFKRQNLEFQSALPRLQLVYSLIFNNFNRSRFHNIVYRSRNFSTTSRGCLSISTSHNHLRLRSGSSLSTEVAEHPSQSSRNKTPQIQSPLGSRNYGAEHGATVSNQIRASPFKMKASGDMHRAIVAFGSNVGNRVAHIENALDSMRKNGIKILKLSRLYETKAMYVENQPSFINGVVAIETHLQPLSLLDLLQKIELDNGRVREIAKGPRTLDLDIILFDEELIDHERLKVPHSLMMEREFVLRPVAE